MNQCHSEYLERNRDKRRAYETEYRRLNKIKVNEYKLKYVHNRRKVLFDILGNVCVKCGFMDIRALQIDHINGGGCKERKIGVHSMIAYYSSHPDEAREKLQILCANCNWIKRVENKEHV